MAIPRVVRRSAPEGALSRQPVATHRQSLLDQVLSLPPGSSGLLEQVLDETLTGRDRQTLDDVLRRTDDERARGEGRWGRPGSGAAPRAPAPAPTMPHGAVRDHLGKMGRGSDASKVIGGLIQRGQLGLRGLPLFMAINAILRLLDRDPQTAPGKASWYFSADWELVKDCEETANGPYHFSASGLCNIWNSGTFMTADGVPSNYRQPVSDPLVRNTSRATWWDVRLSPTNPAFSNIGTRRSYIWRGVTQPRTDLTGPVLKPGVPPVLEIDDQPKGKDSPWQRTEQGLRLAKRASPWPLSWAGSNGTPPPPPAPPGETVEAPPGLPRRGIPRLPGRPRPARPPRYRGRERKVRMAPYKQWLMVKVLEGITEACDAVSAIYNALPAQTRRAERSAWVQGEFARGVQRPSRSMPCDEKAASIARNWREIDVEQMVRELAWEFTSDFLVGKMGQIQSEALGNLTGRSQPTFGWTQPTGEDDRTGWQRGDIRSDNPLANTGPPKPFMDWLQGVITGHAPRG